MSTPNLGRFSDPSILILASLAGGTKHGYAIMEDIESFAGMRPETFAAMGLRRLAGI